MKGTAPLMPYIPTYARQLGVSSTGVGIMYMVLPFIGLIAKPLFGAIADKFKCGKVIFIAAIISTAVFFDCIALIPPNSEKAYVNLQCVNESLSLSTCNVNDECALERIDMEFGSEETMECRLLCDTSDGYQDILEETCNQWDLSENCKANSTVEFFSYSSITHSRYENSCLYFPVDSLLVNQTEVSSLQCYRNGTLLNARCQAICNSSTVMTYIQESANETTPYYETIQYHMLFGFMAGAWASQAVVVALSDAICFSLLGNIFKSFLINSFTSSIV